MLTKDIYHIQLKKPKNQPLSPKGWFFCSWRRDSCWTLDASRRHE
jgi:hypothetical protein